MLKLRATFTRRGGWALSQIHRADGVVGEDRGVTGNLIPKRIEDASFDAQLHI
jgi:hypothetical protein